MEVNVDVLHGINDRVSFIIVILTLGIAITSVMITFLRVALNV